MNFKLILLSILLCLGGLAKAQSPNLVKITTTNDNGRYNTGAKVYLEAYFDEWLSSPSEFKALLNTGDVVTFKFDVKSSSDVLVPFGKPGTLNWQSPDEEDHFKYNKGVNCFIQLKHGKNKGKYLMAGAVKNYEGNTSANYMVITDEKGMTEKTFAFNDLVQWAVELHDGSIVAGGRFTNYSYNDEYDYLIKFKPDFSVDTQWMANCSKLNYHIGGLASGGAGLSNNCIIEDPNAPGAIYVCGGFDTPRRGIVRIKANGEFDPGFTPHWGNTNVDVFTLAIDGNYLWGSGVTVNGSGSHTDTHLYKMNKNDGSAASGYVAPDFRDYNYGGPMSLQVMPEPAEGGPGGVLWVGRSGFTNGSSHIVDRNGVVYQDDNVISFQDDGSLTSKMLFDTHGAFHINNVFGVDGVTLLKDKLWLSYHPDSDGPGNIRVLQQTINGKTVKNEGCLVALNLDGSFSKHLCETWSLPNNGSNTDGFSGGFRDGMTLSTSNEGNILLGGNFNSVAGTHSLDYTANVVFTLQKAKAEYVVSADDLVPELEIVKILDYNVTDINGSNNGTATLPTDPELIFENNHTLAINMPHTAKVDAFVTTWKISNDNESIDIPTSGAGYDFYVNWGDSIKGAPNITYHTGKTPVVAHTYSTPGDYTVRVLSHDGNGFPRIDMEGSSDAHKLKFINQWGNVKWQSMVKAFSGCINMDCIATDTPDLSHPNIDLTAMFWNCENLVGTPVFKNWNVSQVSSTKVMFGNAVLFNQPIGGTSGWNVSNVTEMSGMFSGAATFNQPLYNWVTNSLTNARAMFKNATAFNRDISSWNISKLEEGTGANIGGAANMLDYCGMSIENYDALLINWNANYPTKSNVTFGAADLIYCEGESARKEMIDRGWGDGVNGDQPNDNPDGRIGDYLDIIDGGSVAPEEIMVNDFHTQACLTNTIYLDSLIQYQPWYGKSIQWSKDGISIGNTYSTSGHMAGNVVVLNYELTEDHCSEEVTGNGKLYVELLKKIRLEGRNVRICVDEAENINLNTVLGVAVLGKWTALTNGAETHLDGSRFNGLEAFNNSATDIAYEFRFIPKAGSCVKGEALITVVITNEL